MDKDQKIHIASARGILNADDIRFPELTNTIGKFFVEEVHNFKGDVVGFKEIITGKRIIDRPRDTLFFELLLQIDLDRSLPYQGILFRQHRLPRVGDVWWNVGAPVKKDNYINQMISEYLKQSPEEILMKLDQVQQTAKECINKDDYLKKSDIIKRLVKSKKR